MDSAERMPQQITHYSFSISTVIIGVIKKKPSLYFLNISLHEPLLWGGCLMEIIDTNSFNN